jgi:hypothetical protein
MVNARRKFSQLMAPSGAPPTREHGHGENPSSGERFITDHDASTRIDATGACDTSWQTPGSFLPYPNDDEHVKARRRPNFPPAADPGSSNEGQGAARGIYIALRSESITPQRPTSVGFSGSPNHRSGIRGRKSARQIQRSVPNGPAFAAKERRNPMGWPHVVSCTRQRTRDQVKTDPMGLHDSARGLVTGPGWPTRQREQRRGKGSGRRGGPASQRALLSP